MIFEIFGYIVSTLLCAALISWKYTKDICPYGLKKFLTRLALQNWSAQRPARLVQYDSLHSTCISDIGIFPVAAETELEKPVQLQRFNDSDQLLFYGIDESGNGFLAKITRFFGGMASCSLHLILDGKKYSITRTGTSSSPHEFSLGNLKFELVEPMRIWRVWYNGVMHVEEPELKTSSNSASFPTEAVHVVINLLWKPLDGPFDTQKDVNIHLLSEYLGRNGNFGANFAELSSKILPDGYTQFGVCDGTLKINGTEQSRSLYGFRARYHDLINSSMPSALVPVPKPVTVCNGATHNNNVPNEITKPNYRDDNRDNRDGLQIELFGMCDANGNAFRLTGRNNGWTDGHMLYPSFERNPVLTVNVEPSEFITANHEIRPKYFVLSDKVDSFHVEIWPRVQKQDLTSTIESAAEITLLALTLNGKPARGILLKTHTTPSSSKVQQEMILRHLQSHPVPIKDSLISLEVVPFDSPHCTNVDLVGGKGASLAKLRALANATALTNGRTSKFGTANGFCVTTSLFTSVLAEHETEIKSMFNFTAHTDDLDHVCAKVIKLINSSKAVQAITPQVNSMLREVFGQEMSTGTLRFAVRSSGVLEDLVELSAAGQNETFLNIPPELIPEKVVECWASLFTAQSVQYRLNHGQPAWSQMGVVVQKMVHAKSAGVLFTADPRTGNPFELIINSNFGLGESVVSGAAEPDTIILKKSHQIASHALSVAEKKLGGKAVQIQSNSEAAFTSQISGTSAGEFSLPDHLALRLGEIGLEIEVKLGNWRPVDIEWAIDQDDEIYILQSRAMTSLDTWTEDELIHEMDTGTRTNHEVLTTANTGEVMPGATSTLGLSVVTRMLDASICCKLALFHSDRILPYISRSTNITRQRLLLNMINMIYREVDKEIGPPLAALELTIFGHRLDTEMLHARGAARFGYISALKKFRFLPKAAYCVWDSLHEIKRIVKKYGNYSTKIDLENTQDPKVVYEQLSERLFDILDIGVTHCGMSQCSSLTNMFAFLTLTAGKNVTDWDTALYEDISKILTVGVNVESADIPQTIDELATIISTNKQIVVDDFIKSSPKDALQLLLKIEPLKKALDAFFSKHGHRGYAELDFFRQCWQTEPLPLISLVQSIVNNKIKFPDCAKWSTGHKYASVDELLDSLNTKITGGSRRFLKFILKYCGIGVSNRETTKSLLVRVSMQMKLAYNHLANLLVKERLIKDPKLIYFMTHHEIGQVIARQPSISKILTKAMRRMKLFPELNKEECPEIVFGRFEPVDSDDDTIEYGDSIQATPLSTGRVQATVKVCSSVDEASKILEPGDILITHGTDIAWSPFFPILGGIVTELGGLMSHGAVVAREYGLPCVVGALNATKIFKTGEKVILDARNGTVTKVKNK